MLQLNLVYVSKMDFWSSAAMVFAYLSTRRVSADNSNHQYEPGIQIHNIKF